MNLLLDSAIKVSVLVLIALIGTVVCRRQSAAVRHLILATAVIGATCMPLFVWVFPSWDLPSGITASIEPVVQPLGIVGATAKSAPAADFAKELLSDGIRSVTPGLLFLAAWMIGAAPSLFILISGFARLRWISARAQPIVDRRWADLTAQLSRQIGLTRRVELLHGSPSTLLAAWGLIRPKIILPASATEWPDDRVRIVLAHELAHIQRCDWPVQVAAEFLRSLQWYNPLAWIARKRLRTESERACDDIVLNLGVDAAMYAEQLLDLARALGRPTSVALGIARPSTLEMRIAAMLNADLNRRPMRPSVRIAAIGIFLVVTSMLAGLKGYAQAGSGLSGFILDQTGVGVPDVRVVLSRASSERALRPVSNNPISLRFANWSVFKVIDTLTKPQGIRVAFDPAIEDRSISVQLDRATPRQAIDYIMATSRLSYQVVDERSIFVFPDPTNVLHEARTDSAGYYGFDELPSGSYFVQIRAAGFKAFQDDVFLPAAQDVRRNITIEIGSVTERLTLNESAGSLPAETKDTTVVRQQLEGLKGKRIQPPIFVKRTALLYPASLRGASIGTRVILEGRIGSDGFLNGLQILTDVDPGIKEAVLDIVRQWQWEPTRLNGIAIDVPISLTVDFVPSR